MVLVLTVLVLVLGILGSSLFYISKESEKRAYHNLMVMELNKLERSLKDDSLRVAEKEVLRTKYWEQYLLVKGL